MKTLTTIVGLVIVAIIVVGGWLYSNGKRENAELFDMDVESVGTSQSSMLPTTTSAEVPASLVVEEVVLGAISPYSGSGSATRSYDGRTFNHTVSANISAPAPGKFYEGWLVMPTAAGPQFFSTGRLEGTTGSYSLTYTNAKNFPSHTNVVVTEETEANGLDNKPEAHVLEGSF